MNVPRPPVRLLLVPYDSGTFDARMGAGPLWLVRGGVVERLSERGHAVQEHLIEPSSSWRAELRTAVELHRGIAAAVVEARRSGQVPLMLSGNCNATLGMVAGLAGAGRRIGLVWLDAHGDFNTPDLDPSGFLDGHGLAMVVGRCWRPLTSTVPGFAPLPEQQVVLVGTRSLDDAEASALRRSAVTWLPPAQARDRDAVGAALEALAETADVVHLHVDLDVHDPSIAPANSYAVPDGLSAGDVEMIVRRTTERLPLVSATLASYDPTYDPAGRMRETALTLVDLVASVATPIRDDAHGAAAYRR